MAAAATLVMWFSLRSPELAEDFEHLMASDRDIVRSSLDTMSDWRLTRPMDVPGQAGGGEAADYVLISEDCVIALPGETYEGRDGVRAWRASRQAGKGPQLSAGQPEAVDSTHVLVPLMVEVAIGGEAETVKATGVWTVADGLITEVRAVPGGRRMAIASLDSG